MATHEHTASHLPPSGTGYVVCECGATARCELGRVVSGWHACELCVQRDGVPQELISEEIYHHYCKPEGKHKL